MDDNLAVGVNRAGVTAFSAASAQGIPVFSPLEPLFYDPDAHNSRPPLRQKNYGKICLDIIQQPVV